MTTKKSLRHWQARPFLPHTDMHGDYCTLTPLSATKHGGALWDAFAEDKRGKDWRYLPYGPFADKRAFMRWLRAMTGGKDPQFYAILDNDGAATGMASYLNIVPAHGVVEVGHIHYAPKMQRTAAATETMHLMMHRAFAECGYRRYEWKCDSQNKRSCAAALRLGFHPEGIFRQHQVNKNRNRDSAYFSITDKEWRHINAAMKKWLATLKNGKQTTPLNAAPIIPVGLY
ncbi:MAG: GNAT family N-acetyltransferase [Gammaproteobacteria bacterium]